MPPVGPRKDVHHPVWCFQSSDRDVNFQTSADQANSDHSPSRFHLLPGRRPGVPQMSVSVLIYSLPCAATRILDRKRPALPDVPTKMFS